jgi:hypothetical protein
MVTLVSATIKKKMEKIRHVLCALYASSASEKFLLTAWFRAVGHGWLIVPCGQGIVIATGNDSEAIGACKKKKKNPY